MVLTGGIPIGCTTSRTCPDSVRGAEPASATVSRWSIGKLKSASITHGAAPATGLATLCGFAGWWALKLKTDVSLLLDLDRTLVDVQSYTSYEAAVADVEREMGTIELVGVPDTEWRSATVTAMATLVALTGDPERWQQASDLIEEHEIAAVASARAMKGLRRFLAATSTMPRAIVTLMGQSATRQVCERFQIDVAVQVGRSVELAPKPAPDQVLRACRLLDVVPDEAVMVGDSTWDLSAASAAGAGFVGLTNGRLSEFPRGTKVATSLNAVLAELR